MQRASTRPGRARRSRRDYHCRTGRLHGRYWYTYWRENGHQRTRYVGVTLARLPDIVQHVTHAGMGALEASHVTQTNWRTLSIPARSGRCPAGMSYNWGRPSVTAATALRESLSRTDSTESSAIQLASLTFIIDFAPPAQRPTYVGLATLAQAPFAGGARLLGGVIADRAGYPAVFILTTALAAAGALIVLLSIVDPRMRPEQARSMPQRTRQV